MRLSMLAGHADAGLEAMRPDLAQVLLRVQTDLFAGAKAASRDGIQAFETLALALIPRAEPATLAHVAERLRDHPHLPERVGAALTARAQALGTEFAPLPTGAGKPLPREKTAPPAGAPEGAHEAVSTGLDLALARDSHAMLGGRLLEDMVARARRNRELAEALLARTDLPARSLAPLYLHADPACRAALRRAMAEDGGAAYGRLVRPTRERVAALHDAAESDDKAAFGVRLAQGLGLAAVPDWRFDQPARHDCLALALLAMGAPEEAAIRIFLTFDKALARDVATVFGLVEIIRRTPRSVACALIEAVYEIAIALPQRRAEVHADALMPRAATAGMAFNAAGGSGSARAVGAASREALRAGSRSGDDGRSGMTGSRDTARRLTRDGA